MKGKYTQISLDRLESPEQPLRDDLNQEAVQDLIDSIKQVGIINPLIVKKRGDNFEIVAGHRRLLAAGFAGETEAPCIIIKAKGIKGEVIKLQENLARDKISPIEWANHLAYLKKRYQMETAKIAELLGMSETWVRRHLQILGFPPLLVQGLKADKISFTSARELAQITDPKKRDVYVTHAIRGGVTPTLAAQWKRQANQEPMPTAEPTSQTEPQPTAEPTEDPLPECPICGKAVEPENELDLRIHTHCAPQ